MHSRNFGVSAPSLRRRARHISGSCVTFLCPANPAPRRTLGCEDGNVPTHAPMPESALCDDR
eukprot:6399065-Pyramimonas_sp.AAC.1